MLGRTPSGGGTSSSSSSSRARAEGVTNVIAGRSTIVTDGGQEVTVSQFVAQLGTRR